MVGAEANPGPADPANIVLRMMQPMMAALSTAIVEAVTTGATSAATAAAAAATTAAAIAAAAAAAQPTTKTISSSIDPFDSLSTDMSSKDGKTLWYAITKMNGDWPKKGITCTV